MNDWIEGGKREIDVCVDGLVQRRGRRKREGSMEEGPFGWGSECVE